MTTPAAATPRLLFQTHFDQPVWRLLPGPEVLAVELRDTVARTATFVVLAAVDGRELLRYHDPQTPWWLSLIALQEQGLELAELSPEQLGVPVQRRIISFESPAISAPATAALTLQNPVVYTPESAYFTPLARFVAARTGLEPITRLEYLETHGWIGLAFDTVNEVHQLLLCSATTGAVVLLLPLGMARPGPDATLFCTFGPILYALGAPGEVFAWHLPAA
jgi:hypothetical protein